MDIHFVHLDSHSNFYSSSWSKDFLMEKLENDKKNNNSNKRSINNEGFKLVNYDDENEVDGHQG